MKLVGFSIGFCLDFVVPHFLRQALYLGILPFFTAKKKDRKSRIDFTSDLMLHTDTDILIQTVYSLNQNVYNLYQDVSRRSVVDF